MRKKLGNFSCNQTVESLNLDKESGFYSESTEEPLKVLEQGHDIIGSYNV